MSLKGYKMVIELAKLPSFLPVRYDGKLEKHHSEAQQGVVK